MKKFKNLIYVILASSILCTFLGCVSKNAEKLGETSFSIVLPSGYNLTEDETVEEDQIAYYYKDDNSIDFDVYAWSKENYELKEEAKYFAAEFNSTATNFSINGNDGYLYISIEEFENKLWTVYNYLFEDDKFILELSFWTDGSEKEIADVNAILATLIKE